MQSASTLLESLQDAGERRAIEAKGGLGEATEETLCAFANEPDLGGGYIIFGIEEATDGKFHIVGVADVQKLQHDLASICSTNFNKPIRPEVEIDTIDGRHVVVTFVPEAEIREPLLRAFDRAFSETYDSLPRPFRLPPGRQSATTAPDSPSARFGRCWSMRSCTASTARTGRFRSSGTPTGSKCTTPATP